MQHPPLKFQKAVEHSQRIMRSLQSLTLQELNQVFDEYDLCNALTTNLVQITTRVLELSADGIQAMTSCARKVGEDSLKQVMTLVRATLQTLHQSLEFIKSIGLLLDYLFVDSYRYEQIFRLFVSNEQLLPTVVQIVGEHVKFDEVARCFSKNKSYARSQSTQVFAMLLFKMLTNQCDAARMLFLQSTTSLPLARVDSDDAP
mmetsp:Transcript_21527/g.26473  ORF Transcript_21527/g.26473 Transcript_21527/m.26473 type:complete len:202 (-) Transcript_21527:3290-3895(-)